MLISFFKTGCIEAGIDEAGRGCYAGPVFASAVILPNKFTHPLLNDSKQVKEHHRNELKIYIEQHAIAFSVARVSVEEIDNINILQATFKAMHSAINQLAVTPEFLLIDGNQFLTHNAIPHQCIIKGDAKYASIAAASILAKTYRDAYMLQLHEQFPMYGWNKNKGYGTLQHRKAIEQFGTCCHHRKSFNILPKQTQLFF